MDLDAMRALVVLCSESGTQEMTSNIEERQEIRDEIGRTSDMSQAQK